MRLHSVYELTCYGCGRLLCIERDNTDSPCPHCGVTIRLRWSPVPRCKSNANRERQLPSICETSRSGKVPA